jgi:hypothetical protein
MPDAGAAAVYGLCLATSLACAALLVRAWRHTRTRLLLWTAASFAALAVNNLFLVADLVVFPSVDLWLWRQAASLISVAVLLYGFVWESRS